MYGCGFGVGLTVSSLKLASFLLVLVHKMIYTDQTFSLLLKRGFAMGKLSSETIDFIKKKKVIKRVRVVHIRYQLSGNVVYHRFVSLLIRETI